MGVFNYNYLLNPDSGYIKYGSIIRADFWKEIILIVRYSKPILIIV